MTAEMPVVRTSRWLVRSWVSVALIPVVVVGASYAALLHYRATMYEGADHYVPEWAATGMPWWVQLLRGLVGVALVAIPCLVAAWCGRRAMSDGDDRGRTPRTIGIVALVGYAALVVVPLALSLVLAVLPR
jgi:hypothetical protein